jgi:tRNA threonylcarbamoyladenosine biosynthesis protein TsaB
LKLLAIDTATEACSAALLDGDEIRQKYSLAPRRHADLILGMVDELLVESGMALNQLDALAFGRGPGSFTGIRIAAGVIQGIAFGADLPVIPVSTLAALAQGTEPSDTRILAAIDARMGEIYWAVFERDTDNLVEPVTRENVSRPQDVSIECEGPVSGTGTGWDSYHDILSEILGERLTGYKPGQYPQSRDILLLAKRDFENGLLVKAEDALPVYLRNKVTG